MNRSKPDFRVPYTKVNFFWISNHYDIHLSGLCKMNGELMWFITPKVPAWNERYPKVHLFKLTRREKIRLLARKWWFEFCIGKHWTAPNFRKPPKPFKHFRWFHQMMYNFYYRKEFRRLKKINAARTQMAKN